MADTGTPSAMDVALVERAKAGDREAFGELYDRYICPCTVICIASSAIGSWPKT